jgi:molybdenum cofactor cytidylyltransferase
MLSSVKIGLKSIQHKADAGLIVLGDQPNIEPITIKTIIDTYKNTKKAIIVPSYQRHRGHPFLIDKSCWEEILNLPQDMTLRDFLNSNPQEIYYVNVEDSSILQDMDTPDDYLQQHPYADD